MLDGWITVRFNEGKLDDSELLDPLIASLEDPDLYLNQIRHAGVGDWFDISAYHNGSDTATDKGTKWCACPC